MDKAVSAGILTSHGIQYSPMRSLPSICQGCTNIVGCLENRKYTPIIEIPAIDVRSTLDSSQSERFVATLQFLDRQFSILHEQCAEADETLWIIGNKTCYVVIQ